MAEILRGNIPVKNGVVHLIHRPLMIVDTTVMQFLEVIYNYTHTHTHTLDLIIMTIILDIMYFHPI